MPVDKLRRTDERLIQHIPNLGLTSSIGVTMAQIIDKCLRRVGPNIMTADLDLNKLRLINLNESTAADDAVTR